VTGLERRSTLRLLACLSPLYLWLGAITYLPHKEERFLFVAYPLVSPGWLAIWLAGLACMLQPAGGTLWIWMVGAQLSC
jgi:hypothetical protein